MTRKILLFIASLAAAITAWGFLDAYTIIKTNDSGFVAETLAALGAFLCWDLFGWLNRKVWP